MGETKFFEGQVVHFSQSSLGRVDIQSHIDWIIRKKIHLEKNVHYLLEFVLNFKYCGKQY